MHIMVSDPSIQDNLVEIGCVENGVVELLDGYSSDGYRHHHSGYLDADACEPKCLGCEGSGESQDYRSGSTGYEHHQQRHVLVELLFPWLPFIDGNTGPNPNRAEDDHESCIGASGVCLLFEGESGPGSGGELGSGLEVDVAHDHREGDDEEVPKNEELAEGTQQTGIGNMLRGRWSWPTQSEEQWEDQNRSEVVVEADIGGTVGSIGGQHDAEHLRTHGCAGDVDEQLHDVGDIALALPDHRVHIQQAPDAEAGGIAGIRLLNPQGQVCFLQGQEVIGSIATHAHLRPVFTQPPRTPGSALILEDKLLLDLGDYLGFAFGRDPSEDGDVGEVELGEQLQEVVVNSDGQLLELEVVLLDED